MKFEIYESSVSNVLNGNHLRWEWHWRLRSRNGRIMADSGEGYASRSGCIRAINRLCAGILVLGHRPEIVEVER